MRGLVRWACLLFLGCAPAAEDELRSTQQEIVGGAVDTGDPAVVAFAEDGVPLCTGTLVGSLTVVTAAHCVLGVRANAQLSIAFGTNAFAPTRTVAVTQAFRDARYTGNSPGHDVGVLRLATAVTDVAPVPLNTTPLQQGDVGKMLRHIGYGVTNGTNQTGFGTRRQVALPIRQVTTLELESGATGKQTCNGDSGGPALMVTAGHTAERLIGITSYGDEACTQSGFDTRVDTVAEYVRTTAAGWETLPTCAADGACLAGCAPVDVDCACAQDGMCTAQCPAPLMDPDCIRECGANGACAALACATPDPDCLAAGTACSAAAQCLGKQCVSDAQHPATYCSTPCGLDAGSSACPGGTECAAGACRFVQKPEVPLGQACSAQTFCLEGGVCTGPTGAATVCSRACDVSNACAATSEECVAGANTLRYCRTRAVIVPGVPSAPAAPAAADGGVVKGGMLPEASGCQATTGGPLALLLAPVALWLARRRRSAG